MRSNWSRVAVLALAGCVTFVACGEDTHNPPSTGGSSGSKNDAGEGGSSSAGKTNSGGKTGKQGNAGSSVGGEGGNGTSGDAGNGAGIAGMGPEAGAGGAAAGAGGAAGGVGGAGEGGEPAVCEPQGIGGEGFGGYPGDCHMQSDFGTVCAVEADGISVGAVENNTALVFWNDFADSTRPDELQVQLFKGFGPFTNGIVPGEYPITGDELSYATCAVCVLIYEDYLSDSIHRGTYLATGGTVTITQVEPKIIGSLKNVTFGHVDNETHTTPIDDSCTTEIDELSFDSDIVQL